MYHNYYYFYLQNIKKNKLILTNCLMTIFFSYMIIYISITSLTTHSKKTTKKFIASVL